MARSNNISNFDFNLYYRAIKDPRTKTIDKNTLTKIKIILESFNNSYAIEYRTLYNYYSMGIICNVIDEILDITEKFIKWDGCVILLGGDRMVKPISDPESLCKRYEVFMKNYFDNVRSREVYLLYLEFYLDMFSIISFSNPIFTGSVDLKERSTLSNVYEKLTYKTRKRLAYWDLLKLLKTYNNSCIYYNKNKINYM